MVYRAWVVLPAVHCPVLATLRRHQLYSRTRHSEQVGSVPGKTPLGSGPSCSLGKPPWVTYPAQSCPASSEIPPGWSRTRRSKNGS